MAQLQLGGEIELTPRDLEILSALREKFAPQIQDKHAQIKLVEQLIAYLSAHYPDDWQDRIHAFLKQLFPELADALYAKFEGLSRYNDWLRSNRNVLLRMDAAGRRQALWEARREAFGADAEAIFAAELKNQQIRDTLAALDVEDGRGVEQKFASYMEAVQQAYGEQSMAQIQNRQTELMNGFLGVGAVQADLHAMTATERSASLRAIRAAMGMDEAALARWELLDRERDGSWTQGEAYMAERGRIESQYEGEEEQERLHALQAHHFGDDAETIRREEAAGFYRYGHLRRYGRE